MKETCIFEETSPDEKWPMNMNRDLWTSKETYKYEKRPMNVKETCTYEETSSDQNWPMTLKRDLGTSKETYEYEKRLMNMKEIYEFERRPTRKTHESCLTTYFSRAQHFL